MDREWIEALGEKEYLFPLEWPLTAWIVNLAYVPLIVLIYRHRAAASSSIGAKREWCSAVCR